MKKYISKSLLSHPRTKFRRRQADEMFLAVLRYNIVRREQIMRGFHSLLSAFRSCERI